ncbi:hypothetical protein BH09ACT10_BH09ACT10_27100 [soil metagenome]
MAVDLKAVPKNDLIALVAGGLAIIVSFISSYVTYDFSDAIGGIKIPGADTSVGISAWHSWATIGVLLIIVATAIVAVRTFAPDTLPDTVPWNLVTVAAAGLGTILVILRAITVSPGGPGWSGYALFIFAIVLTVVAALNFRASGEKIPEFGNSKPDA